MRATRRRASAAYGFALRAAMALLIAIAGLVCTQASATAASAPAAHSAATAQPHPQLQTADVPSTDATAFPSSCSSDPHQEAEAPASTRHEATASTPVVGPGVLPARGHGDAQVVPGRGGPAPPPYPPSYEELSVLRV